jgi:glutamate formiminotransferase / 5-formyltetrahydrofolate cyclo-ligase
VSAPDVASAVNLSEGRNTTTIDRLCDACDEVLLDVHRDPDHNRSVLTLGGPPVALLAAVRALVEAAVAALDLRGHRGLHPRFGVVDVVPFTPVGSTDLTPALELRDRLAIWAGVALGVPCFLYGPMPDGGTRSLPEVRKGAFTTLLPDTGPRQPHPSAGAMAVGARGPLVAYNLWVEGVSKTEASAVARRLRGEAIRVLGLVDGQFAQISCNLTDPDRVGPAEAYDAVAGALPAAGRITRAELVGLVPAAVLERTPQERWEQLDLSADASLEARLSDASLRRLRS